MNPKAAHYLRSIGLTFVFMILGSFAVSAVHRASAFFIETLDFDAMMAADDKTAFVANYMSDNPMAVWWAIAAHALGAGLAVYMTTRFTKVPSWVESARKKSFVPALVVTLLYLMADYINDTMTVPMDMSWVSTDMALTVVFCAFAFRLGGGQETLEPGQMNDS